jgi:glyoxylase-like metal-dependent hydrolase (beta-lactamase superfamily II)
MIDLHFQNEACTIAAFLIETGDSPILVETGPHSTFPNLKRGIEELGYQLSDIKDVFISHIHLDHAGASWCMAEAGAKIHLHPFGFRHMKDPSKLLASAKMIYQDEMDRLWGTLKPIPEDQLIIAEDGDIFKIGDVEIESVHTPGHAKHHIAWKMGPVLFTGDVAGVAIHKGPVIPPCPPPDIDIEAWQASLVKIKSLTDVETFYLTHFGIIEDPSEHLAKISDGLTKFANFLLPFAMKGIPPEDTVQPFSEFVINYLIGHGMDETDANLYEIANPSYMGAYGLMRYWKKQLDSL